MHCYPVVFGGGGGGGAVGLTVLLGDSLSDEEDCASLPISILPPEPEPSLLS